MPPASPGRSAALCAAIQAFLQDRLDTKLKPLPPDDPQRQTLPTQFEFKTWIANAARRAGQIQVVTHALKATHPDARGTSLYKPPQSLAQHPFIGSHCLRDGFAGDVVGNAAALDVYKLLRITHDGRTLLDLMLAGDPDLLAALSDDVAEAQAWVDAFTGIAAPRGTPASHTQAKQLYWLVGDDPREDGDYHLLAPLYASSLAHEVHTTINEDRFGEPAKAARQARRDEAYSDTVIHEYPHLAVQKLGGTKPQNISQLNSERGGNNYLLASLPPLWETSELQAPLRMENAIHAFGRLREVRRLVRELAGFLKRDPAKTMETRNARDGWTDQLVDELLHYGSLVQNTLKPGWSADPECQLLEHQQLWLDPHRAIDDPEFAQKLNAVQWSDMVCDDFAKWLNDRLAKTTGRPMGDAEETHWNKELQDHLAVLKGGLSGDL
jgi:CRISPR-associated protein Csy1